MDQCICMQGYPPTPILIDNTKLKASHSRKLAKHAHLPIFPRDCPVLMFIKERDKIKSSEDRRGSQ